MLPYTDITRYFGSSLADKDFESFLRKVFVHLTEYNILDTGYIMSDSAGIELGFTNNNAVFDDNDQIIFEKGNPIFSHCNLYPKSVVLIDRLPFDISFTDSRKIICNKAGVPMKTNKGYSTLLNKSFLVDSYKIDNLIVTFDYNPEDETIIFISIRDNDLVKHLKL